MTGNSLSPYTGAAAACPKCTCKKIDDRYFPYRPLFTLGELGPMTLGTDRNGESIMRICCDCGYAWLEACADAAGGPP